MQESSVPLTSSPVPSAAWSGRSWWKTCCTGCCLGIVFIPLTLVAMSMLGARWQNARWQAFWGYPRTIIHQLRQILPR